MRAIKCVANNISGYAFVNLGKSEMEIIII